MKIAFVGTCQTEGMSLVAQRLLPAADIVDFVPRAPEDGAAIAARIADADFVITQRQDTPGVPDEPLSERALSTRHAGVQFVPPIVFAGFHPDMFYLTDNGRMIPGAFADYHHQLTIAGFLAGLDETRTIALYNSHVFAELGYLDAFRVSQAALAGQMRAAGLDIDRLLTRWARRGRVFMHTINHPKLSLLQHLCVAALTRLGLIGEELPDLKGIRDPLADGIVTPVFTPLARRLNVPEQPNVIRPVGLTPPQEHRAIPFRRYVEDSFAIYRGLDPDMMRRSMAAPVIGKVAELLS